MRDNLRRRRYTPGTAAEPADSDRSSWSLADRAQWERTLAAGVEAQRLVADAVAVGGTAAALYANHRLSIDTDHLVSGLRAQYDDVLHTLEESPRWRTARVQPPVLILGSLDGVPVGYRQSLSK